MRSGFSSASNEIKMSPSQGLRYCTNTNTSSSLGTQQFQNTAEGLSVMQFFYDIICSQPQITEPLWLNLGILDMDGRNRGQSVGAVFAHPQTHCILENYNGLDTYHVHFWFKSQLQYFRQKYKKKTKQNIETCMAMQPKTPNSFLFFLSVDLVALPSLLVVNFLCKGVYD